MGETSTGLVYSPFLPRWQPKSHRNEERGRYESNRKKIEIDGRVKTWKPRRFRRHHDRNCQLPVPALARGSRPGRQPRQSPVNRIGGRRGRGRAGQQCPCITQPGSRTALSRATGAGLTTPPAICLIGLHRFERPAWATGERSMAANFRVGSSVD